MQDFPYNYIKNKIMYEIEDESVYEGSYKCKELFVFSNYPEDYKYYNNANNLVVGKMKDETCEIPIKGSI